MDVDEATSAMIAQVLAEENPYQIQEFDEVYDDPDDSDYSGTPRQKRARKNPRGNGVAGKSKGRGGKSSTPRFVKSEEEEAEDDTEEGRTATGRRKRKDTGVRRAKGRSWTAEEEQLFLEGLELHGRDWKSCAKHVGTRDAKSLTSHAQKHFIKLCMKGYPLPAKVKESGVGYTLSGKLLDPTSTSAKAYGFNPHVLKDLSEDEYKISVSGVLVDKLLESETVIPAPGRRRKLVQVVELDPHALENIAPVEGKGVSNSVPISDSADMAQVESNCARDAPDSGHSLGDWTNANSTRIKDTAANQVKQAGSIPNVKSNRSTTASVPRADTRVQSIPGPPVMTDYAKARPRRATSTKKLHMGETTESLDLVECLSFVGVAGSRSVGSQPFSVDVSNQALLVMDCHSHLSECEIIGLLGGHWNPDARHLCVVEAFPCSREAGSEARTSVELNPEAEVQARAKMQEQGLTSVGWYHSHPVFEPAPSKKDMENQRNYQALFRDEESRSEPFVGFIIGPYDAQLLTPRSALSAFVVQEKDGCLNPYKIQYSVSRVDETPTTEIMAKLYTIFDDLRSDVARVDLGQMWRPFTSLRDGQPEGPALTKIQKFQSSVQAYFPQDRESEAKSFVSNLCEYIETSWNVKLGLKVLEETELPVMKI